MDRSGSLRSEVPVRSHYYSRYRFFHSWGQWVRAILHVPPSGLASVGGPHRGRACVCQGAALLSFAFTHSLLSHRLPRQSLGSYPFSMLYGFPLHGCVFTAAAFSSTACFVVHLGYPKIASLSNWNGLHECAQIHGRPIGLLGHPLRFGKAGRSPVSSGTIGVHMEVAPSGFTWKFCGVFSALICCVECQHRRDWTDDFIDGNMLRTLLWRCDAFQ